MQSTRLLHQHPIILIQSILQSMAVKTFLNELCLIVYSKDGSIIEIKNQFYLLLIWQFGFTMASSALNVHVAHSQHPPIFCTFILLIVLWICGNSVSEGQNSICTQWLHRILHFFLKIKLKLFFFVFWTVYKHQTSSHLFITLFVLWCWIYS